MIANYWGSQQVSHLFVSLELSARDNTMFLVCRIAYHPIIQLASVLRGREGIFHSSNNALRLDSRQILVIYPSLFLMLIRNRRQRSCDFMGFPVTGIARFIADLLGCPMRKQVFRKTYRTSIAVDMRKKPGSC